MVTDEQASAHDRSAAPLVSRVPRTPAREAVVAQLLDLMRSGAYRPGDRLPPEPELIRLTGVGRSTIREAMRSLASMQLVDIQPGRGTFVCGGSGRLLDDPQMQLFLNDRQVLFDLMEARQLIEPAIARLAAERATVEDLDVMRAALAAQTEACDDATWRQTHLAFHAALARATHNVVLTRMWASVATFLRDSPLIAASPPPANWNSVGGPLHSRLHRALVAHDADEAVAAMAAHIADMLTYPSREAARAGKEGG